MNKMTTAPSRQQAGFSLIDIMVGLVIGMLTILAIMQFFVFWEGQKRTSTGGASAQTTGTHALFTVEQRLRNAGYGMGMAAALGCSINRSLNGTQLPVTNLVPVEITDGAAGAADTIHIVYGTAENFSVPAKISFDHPPQATNFCLYSTLGFKVGDFAVAWDSDDPAKACTMVQVTNIPPSSQQQGGGPPDSSNCKIQVKHQANQNTPDWNLPGGQNIFPPGGYPKNKGYLFNFGQLVDVTYSVTSAYNLQEVVNSSTPSIAVGTALFPDIVTLQAEYGKDTDTDGDVDAWNNLTPANSAEWQQVLAVRMVIAARSVQEEKLNVTDTGFVAANAPAWAANLVDLSLNPDGSNNPNWRKFRYKIFATVVPLRNTIWRQ